MPDRATPLPARRPELVIRPLGDDGRYVVKDPRTGEFFQLGEAEHFLLTQLDGVQTADAVRAAYAERFGEPLSEDDLDEFVELARSQGFVECPEAGARHGPDARFAASVRSRPHCPATRAEHPLLAAEPLRPRPAVHLAAPKTLVLLDAGLPVRLGRLHPSLAVLAGLGQPAGAGRQLRPRPALGDGRRRLADAARGHAPARVRPRADLQALRRRGPRDRLPAAVPHAVLLLQRLRRLAVPGAVEAAVGDVRRRLLRAVPVGAGGLRLAADAAGQPRSTTWPSWCCRSAASRRCSTSTRC